MLRVHACHHPHWHGMRSLTQHTTVCHCVSTVVACATLNCSKLVRGNDNKIYLAFLVSLRAQKYNKFSIKATAPSIDDGNSVWRGCSAMYERMLRPMQLRYSTVEAGETHVDSFVTIIIEERRDTRWEKKK